MSDAFYKKPLAGLLLAASATGGPYLLFETQAGRDAASLLGQTDAASPSDRNFEPSTSNGLQPANHPMNPGIDEHTLVQPPVYALQEVLRFDISPGWVLSRFPRVSTVLAETQTDGLRVPLITGTNPHDIAGTLTYSFDQYKRVQRVTVHGATGDPSRFVHELQQHYQMQQVPSLGGMLYTLQWNGRPTSIVYIEPASVIYADSPYARFNVLIELNQAGLGYGLSPQAEQLIQAGKSNRRW